MPNRPEAKADLRESLELDHDGDLGCELMSWLAHEQAKWRERALEPNADVASGLAAAYASALHILETVAPRLRQ